MQDLKVVSAPVNQPTISVAPPPPQPKLSVAPPMPQTALPPVQSAPIDKPQITSIGDAVNQQPTSNAPKKSVDEFANAIKAQYPDYANADNMKLAQAMLQKYPEYASQVDMPSTSTTAPVQKGFWGDVGDLIKNGPIGQMVIGGAKELGKTVVGLGKLSAKIPGSPTYVADQAAKTMGVNNATDQLLSKADPHLQQNGGWQKVGGILETGLELAAPTGIVNKGKVAMEGLGAAAKLPELAATGKLGGVVSWATQKLLNSLPEAGLGYAYGLTKSGGDTQQAKNDALTFGILSGAGEVAGDAWRAVKGSIGDNVTKALGIRGSMNPTQVMEKVPQATRALKVISNLSPDIVVKDINGVEKAFDPAKADFYETMQAWTKSRDMIYNAYTDLAEKAGDKGASFTQADMSKVVDTLNSLKQDTTAPFKNKVDSLIKDLQENFKFGDVKFGGPKAAANEAKYNNIPLKRIQDFIQNVNTDVNPLSNKAAAEVSQKLSQTLREIMDNKITTSTGKGYQALRNSYGDLKSIEKDLVAQFKRAANKSSQNSISDWIQGFGTIDGLVGALSHNPIGAAKGTALAALGKLMKYLKDPEVALREAFKQLSEDQTASPAAIRAFGGAKKVTAPPVK